MEIAEMILRAMLGDQIIGAKVVQIGPNLDGLEWSKKSSVPTSPTEFC